MGKILTAGDIKRILPQRYPLLMVDRAERIGNDRARGLKNVTINELFFQGHFPVQPIMPGVLQVEAIKQLAELLVRDELDPAGDADVYMRKAEKIKFRKPNVPGDRMLLEVEVRERRDGEIVVAGKASNKSGLCCEGLLTLAVRPRTMTAEMPELFTEFDRDDEHAMSLKELMNLMPHRYPFLLIDYMSKINGDEVIAIKNLTVNEELFAHCDPSYMALPESILCEIMAQSGCACVLARPENKGKLGFFMAIDKAEVFAPVFPGDQLICEILLPPGKSRFGKGTGRIRVGDKVVFEITLMFAIMDA